MSEKIPFTKMVGAGNDFIVIEPQKNFDLKKFTTEVCNRHNGIGADGVLVVEPSKKADYKMRIINSDGSEAEMCGNGVRCLASYIVATREEKKKPFSIETLAGIILAEAKDEIANVRLSDPKDYQANIKINVHDRPLTVHYIDTGVPHTIVFVADLSTIDVNRIGPLIRYHEHFKPRGTNVNFVEELDQDFIELRTYERGVEAETLACGTGSVAAGLIGFRHANPDIRRKKGAAVKVKTKSGEVLDITFDLDGQKISNVWLKGSAKFIARGEYYV